MHFKSETPLRRRVLPESVLFDLDGTLVDERSSWEWVHDHFGVDNEQNVRRYLDGELDDLAFMAADIKLWHQAAGGPIHIDEIAGILDAAPIMEGAGRLVDAIHDAGIPTAIVSGGIDILAERIADLLNIEVSIANSLATDSEGYLTGDGICRVMLEDKASPAGDALALLGCRPGGSAAVGNSRFDVPMFRVAGLGIAFAAIDDVVVEGADVVIEDKDLADVIPHLLDEDPWS